MKRVPFFVCLMGILITGTGVWGQTSDLALDSGDLVLEQRYDSGFHLFIRKKPGLGSVLITETTRDPALKSDNYAYRAPEWNRFNGDEIRLINEQPLPPESHIYSLISSTVENHPALGEAFHIFIPWIIRYGYEDTRHGETYVTDGTYLNLRAFSLPYGDYRGAFHDNPYLLRATQRLVAPLGRYLPSAEASFREISQTGHGKFVHSRGPDDLVNSIQSILEAEIGKNVDIVLCLDTTESMKNDIDRIRSALVPMLEELTLSFTSFRLGMVLYKDFSDEYTNLVVPFTHDFAAFQKNINAIRVRGGRDLPEAVYEALYEGAVRFPWEAESRIMILIGDAPPHPVQRGEVSRAMLDAAVTEQGIRVSTVILPQ